MESLDTMTTDSDLPRRISTGSLPRTSAVEAALNGAHERFGSVTEGALSPVYPALGRANPDHFGLALVGATGVSREAGDAQVPFSLMSVAKPFAFAIACEHLGVATAAAYVGANATGLPFNSARAIEAQPDGRTNPMVNPGAIATVSVIPGESLEARWDLLLSSMSAFAGSPLELDLEMLECARATNFQNRALAMLLAARGAIHGDPADAVELYTRQSSLSVTCLDLATMGATLAHGGANPVTGRRVVGPESARAALAAMAISGLYETSGAWLMEIGLPGKSGIGGGIVTVSPGKGALGTFSPLLDGEGNSVRGILAARAISRDLGLDIFASSPQ